MSAIWNELAAWFAGKKTILGGVAMIVAAGLGVWYGKLDPVSGLGLAGLGFSAIGLGDKANRHQAQLLTVLQGIAQAGVDLRSGKAANLLSDAEKTGSALAPSVASDALNALSPGLHIQASTPEELAAILKSLVPPAPIVVRGPLPTSLNSILETANRLAPMPDPTQSGTKG